LFRFDCKPNVTLKWTEVGNYYLSCHFIGTEYRALTLQDLQDKVILDNRYDNDAVYLLTEAFIHQEVLPCECCTEDVITGLPEPIRLKIWNDYMAEFTNP